MSNVSYWSLTHVERVVLVLDGHDHAVQRAGQPAGAREVAILRRGNFERIGHRRAVVGLIRQRPRLARVEAPRRPRRGAQVQGRQRVDLPGIADGGDRPEDALRLVHARTVVGLHPAQIELDEADRRNLSGLNGALDIGDGGVLQMEPGRPLRGNRDCPG
jgi:hypothetical protein